MRELNESDPEFTLYLVHETDDAYLCSEHDPQGDRDAYESKQFWLPKSQCEIMQHPVNGQMIPEAEFSARIAQWLAERRGLV